MNGPDIGQVEQRLAAVISKERRAAISYTLLTVLCTPAFVVLGSLGILLWLPILQGIGRRRQDGQ